jgi:predicted MFS family arabinose efflux permease
MRLGIRCLKLLKNLSARWRADLNRNLFFVAAALFLWGFGEGMFFNFVPIYLDVQFLLSKYEIGLILGAFGFSMAITHIPAGRLAV